MVYWAIRFFLSQDPGMDRQLFGHGEANCKTLKSHSAPGLHPSKSAVPKCRPLCPSSPVDLHNKIEVPDSSLPVQHPTSVNCELVCGAPDPECQPGVSVQLGAMHRDSVGTGFQSEAGDPIPSVEAVASSEGGSALADSDSLPTNVSSMVGGLQDEDRIVSQEGLIPPEKVDPEPLDNTMPMDALIVESDPMFQAIQLLLDANEFRLLFADFPPEHKDIVLGFLHCCWHDVSIESKLEFNSAFPSDVAVQEFSPGALLDALRCLVTAEASKTYIAFLSPVEESNLADLLVGLRGDTSSFSPMRSDRRVFEMGNCQAEQEEAWQKPKSRRRRKSASYKIRTSLT
ncbi:hypothetical protein Nepgr_022922 [Nepenthes gracilis]|uniref:Uncharacterized protein n=1 Tax=Nepenthes gracilis TaxID=150966 RepID=A0AAD3T0C4_NEPGR|nr:hypothetical protein Nepgr_022922 [Nepenthes gracilis]